MKAIVKLLLPLGCAALLASCDHGVCCGEYDTSVAVIVKNKDGQNLLDTNTFHHYAADSIRLYYMKNGVAQEVYYPNQGARRNFSVYQTYYGEATLVLTPDIGTSDKETTINLLQWRAGDNSNIDTIYTEIIRPNDSWVRCDKVTYKNKVIWDSNSPPDTTRDDQRVVRIVK